MAEFNRDKLVELIKNLDVYSCDECQNCDCYKYDLECCDSCFSGKVADYIIANYVVEKNCRGDELRRFLEDEIENTYDLLSDTMNPCFDGVIVGRGEAQVLRENHIRFCKRLLSVCD